jgi:hypothetical protein
MHRFARFAVAAVAAGTLLLSSGAAVRAQDGSKPVIIGATWLFSIRNGDTLNGKEWTVQDRIDHLQDVFAKHLGGQYAKFSAKKWGDRVHLYLNDEFVLAVTPADAKSVFHKSTVTLAPIWMKKLAQGFDDTHTPITGSGRK